MLNRLTRHAQIVLPSSYVICCIHVIISGIGAEFCSQGVFWAKEGPIIWLLRILHELTLYVFLMWKHYHHKIQTKFTTQAAPLMIVIWTLSISSLSCILQIYLRFLSFTMISFWILDFKNGLKSNYEQYIVHIKWSRAIYISYLAIAQCEGE